MTSKGEEPWVRFSPFYPHGGIPVPGTPGTFAQSVEGLWQGLKVFEHEDIDPSRWEIADMKGIKRAGREAGQGARPPLRRRQSDVLLGYRDARYSHLPARLPLGAGEPSCRPRSLGSATRPAVRTVVLLDYETNADVEDLSSPLSHAALVKPYLESRWPSAGP